MDGNIKLRAKSPCDQRIDFYRAWPTAASRTPELLQLLNSFILLLLLTAVSAEAKDLGPLRLEKEIPLPGVEGRIDHFSADEAGQRLFVAALGNGSVEIVDLRKGERTAEIKGLEEPQGLYYDSKLANSLLPREETASCGATTGNLLLSRTRSSSVRMPTTSDTINKPAMSGLDAGMESRS